MRPAPGAGATTFARTMSVRLREESRRGAGPAGKEQWASISLRALRALRLCESLSHGVSGTAESRNLAKPPSTRRRDHFLAFFASWREPARRGVLRRPTGLRVGASLLANSVLVVLQATGPAGLPLSCRLVREQARSHHPRAGRWRYCLRAPRSPRRDPRTQRLRFSRTDARRGSGCARRCRSR